MRDIEIEGGEVRFVGALDFDRSEHGVTPRRLPDWTRAQVPLLMEVMVTMPSGVRIEFATDSLALELEVLLTTMDIPGRGPVQAPFELHVDGERFETRTASGGNRVVLDLLDYSNMQEVAGDPSTVRFDGLPPGDKHCALWLPTNAQVEIRAIRVDGEAQVRSVPERERRRWIHHGSSISHCHDVARPTNAWPVVAARLADVELLSLGLGGSCHLDPFVARTMRDEPADLISLKAGINIVNADSLRGRTFTPLLHGFVDTLREGHPDTPILLVSPIICPAAENHPGPTVPDAKGRFVTVDRPPELMGDSLTLERIRAITAEVARDRRAAGDDNLYYLDGLVLFGPDDVGDLPDALHPNEAGYVRMGERFFEHAFGDGKPFAQR